MIISIEHECHELMGMLFSDRKIQLLQDRASFLLAMQMGSSQMTRGEVKLEPHAAFTYT